MMDREDQDWINAHLEEIDNPEEDFNTKLYLSTDGKMTVEVSTDKAALRPKMLKYAEKLFDRVKEKYGSKQAHAVKEYKQADTTAKSPTDAPSGSNICPIDGQEMKQYSKGNQTWYSHFYNGKWCSGK